MSFIYFLTPLIIASLVPLTLVAMGALFSERSGVVNIALEGIMLMGAFVGAIVIINLEKTNLGPQFIIFVGLIAGAIIGAIFSLLHAYAAINMKSNQIISATALNMIAPAFTVFISRTFTLGRLNPATGLPVTTLTQRIVLGNNYRITSVPFLGDIPFIGDLFFKGAFVSTYVGVVIFIVAVIALYKTKWGLRLRSCGENPQAADSLGINIYKIRYQGVVISGALAGMGGVIFITSFAGEFNASVAGFGFLALAVLIFGNWKPKRILLAALFFATMRVISSTYSGIPIIKDLPIASEIYAMLPYIATLIVLAFISKKSASPKAAGEPYDAGKR